MKKRCRVLVGVVLFAMLLLCFRKHSFAADENISVTVPANVDIVFQSDGTNAISTFSINNDSLVPIHVTTIRVNEHNNWKLVSNDTLINADTKQLVLKLNGQCLCTGENGVNITVAESSKRELDLEVRRGAWNASHPSEKALTLELEYAVGTKMFDVVLDGDGSDVAVPTLSALNGQSVILPTPTKVKHNFLGWKDEEGAIHHGQYVVPIGGTKLTALWEATTAYAIFSADDGSLTFVRSVTPIEEGSIYDGKVATYVYTGFEDKIYYEGNQVPWYMRDGYYSTRITKVVVKDVIQPVGTAFWFFCARNCTYYDLRKLDTSKVTNMISMFSNASDRVKGTVEILGLGNWKVSNVQYFSSTFSGCASQASTLYIDNLNSWDTTGATDMSYMFNLLGRESTNDWSIDCRSWNVDKVKGNTMFNNQVESKVLLPNWVN